MQVCVAAGRLLCSCVRACMLLCGVVLCCVACVWCVLLRHTRKGLWAFKKKHSDPVPVSSCGVSVMLMPAA